MTLLTPIAHAASAGDGLGQTVPSCVPDSPPIRLGLLDSQVLLDRGDRDLVHQAIVERYPALSGEATTPDGLLLWKRQDGHWVYVQLAAKAGEPTSRCFTAVFAADRYSYTRVLIQRYFQAT